MSHLALPSVQARLPALYTLLFILQVLPIPQNRPERRSTATFPVVTSVPTLFAPMLVTQARQVG